MTEFADILSGAEGIMIIFMERSLCDANLAFCAHCSAAFFQKPMGADRPCITKIIDDGDDETLAFVVMTDGRTLRFHLTEQTAEGLRLEGWEFLADFDPAYMRSGAAERWRSLALQARAASIAAPS